MSVSAKRHAQAAFQIALERNEVEGWRSELNTIASTLSDTSLATILENPKVRFSDKVMLINRVLPDLSQLALNFVYLLIARQRLRILSEVAEYYGRLADDHKGVEHAKVTTAVPLDAESQAKLAEHLASITGKQVVLTTEIDPAIIGGFVARIGDKLINGSIRGKLENLKKRLQEETAV